MGSYKWGYKSPTMGYNYSITIVTMLITPLKQSALRPAPEALKESIAAAEALHEHLRSIDSRLTFRVGSSP